MKKITFYLFALLLSLTMYSQFPTPGTEGFENTTGPAGTTWTLGTGATGNQWAVFDNGFGTLVSWTINNGVATPPLVCSGTNSAYANRENIGQGNTSEDYLATPLITVPTNGQLSFTSRTFTLNDQGTRYQIRIAPGNNPTNQTNPSSYTLLREYTETELTLNETVSPAIQNNFNICTPKVIDLSTYVGQQVYIAFVKIFTQPDTAIGGDRWLLDEVVISSSCALPTNIIASSTTTTSASISWTNVSGASSYEIEIVPSGGSFTGVGTTASNPYTAAGLLANTNYDYRIRTICSAGVNSSWSSTNSFTTTNSSGGTQTSENIYTVNGTLTNERVLNIDNKKLTFRNNDQESIFNPNNTNNEYINESILGVYDKNRYVSPNIESKGLFSVGSYKNEGDINPILFFGPTKTFNWLQSSLNYRNQTGNSALPLSINPMGGNVGINLGIDGEPQNTLELDGGLTGTSGLRFRNYTSSFNPTTSTNKFLTVNASGDVVLQNVATTNGNFWGLTGNVGTNPTNNFVGTTDNADLAFRRNNIGAGYIGKTTTSLGNNSNFAGANNTYIGAEAGITNTPRNDNTFIGYGAGRNSTGNYNVYIGSNVVPFGLESWGLRIHSSYDPRPLIQGKFDTRGLLFNLGGNQTPQISNKLILNGFPGTPSLRLTNLLNSAPNNKFLTTNNVGDVVLQDLPVTQTVIQAGTNTTVSGLGTTASPYQINATVPAFTEVDGSVTNELQTLTLSGNVLGISSGNSVTLPTYVDTDDQTLSISGNVLSISEGNNVTIPTTSIIAGNNVTVTGNGTSSQPYQISSTDTSIYRNDGAIINAINHTRTVHMNNNNIMFISPLSDDGVHNKIYIGNNTGFTSFPNGTPQGYKLYVEGGILSEKVRVALRNSQFWADNVFNKEYKLTPLKEIESFIKENKHLPGIESADELVKNGLDLGEMQAKQMGKIEELTLHLIEQNKMIEKQSEEIEELKALVKSLVEKK